MTLGGMAALREGDVESALGDEGEMRSIDREGGEAGCYSTMAMEEGRNKKCQCPTKCERFLSDSKT